MTAFVEESPEETDSGTADVEVVAGCVMRSRPFGSSMNTLFRLPRGLLAGATAVSSCFHTNPVLTAVPKYSALKRTLFCSEPGKGVCQELNPSVT